MVSRRAELQARHELRTFRLDRSCCYEALLVDEERGRLFVGAENHVASLSLDNISKRPKKVPGTPSLTAAQGRSPGAQSRLPGEALRDGPPSGPLTTENFKVPDLCPLTACSWPGRPLWNGERTATGQERTSG